MFSKLLKWSQKFQDLPWRNKRTLYSTLVSEIMLQQTTVGTVLNHYEKFLKEYPTIFDLAQASEEQLTISWKGLGYYRRARNLKKACEHIVNDYKGDIPLHYETLISIPGIGPYTASALIAIGGNKPAIAVDANLERVLSRLFTIDEFKGPKLQKKIQENDKILKLAKKLGARDFNEALMDLGRNICQARKASCEICPLRSGCMAYEEKAVLHYPRIKEVKKESFELELARFIVKKKDSLLVYQKKKGQWLEGQWEVPTFILRSEDKKLIQYPILKYKINKKESQIIKTGITKYKIINYLLELDYSDFKKLNVEGDYKFRPIKPESNLASNISKFLKK